MKLIIWLWNPWKEYITTRHNAGFLALDRLADQHAWTTFLYNKKFDADIAQGMRKKRQIMAIKPQGYMNRSGDAVSKVMQFYQIAAEHTLVIHDELDIPAGTVKLKFNGGHGGHNGIRDIIEKCGSARFWRLRIGIGRPVHPAHDISDRVLSTMTESELAALQASEKEITLRIDECMRNMG